jgi:GNAT superfamily N-acetyltransferase
MAAKGPPHIKTIEVLEAGNGDLLLTAVDHAGRIQGTAHVESRSGSTVYLRDLHVDVWGRGTGKALLDEVKVAVRRRGIIRIECDVSAYRGDFHDPQSRHQGDQERLERLYRWAGFEADPDASFGSWSCGL